MGEALDAAASKPFNWATWNCCHFVDAIVLAMTGTAPLGDYAGAFTDEATAWEVLSKRDGNLRAACRRVFGGMTPAHFAKRGDVVLARGGMAIGICVGAKAAFASDDGAGLSLAQDGGVHLCLPARLAGAGHGVAGVPHFLARSASMFAALFSENGCR